MFNFFFFFIATLVDTGKGLETGGQGTSSPPPPAESVPDNMPEPGQAPKSPKVTLSYQCFQLTYIILPAAKGYSGEATSIY